MMFIKFRSIAYIFRKDWYCLNRLNYSKSAYKKYYWITDIGFITIGKRKLNEENRNHRNQTEKHQN